MTRRAGRKRVSAGVRLRSLLFFLLYGAAGIGHSMLCLLVGPFLPFAARYRFVNGWTVATMWLLQRLNGVRIHVEGAENLPIGAAVVLANHQSSWETFYLQLLISPQATVLKRELLWVPFFGWAAALLRPIPIDRGHGRSALKALLREGGERLKKGVPVVVYPEGSRQPPGTIGRFNVGGALLACRHRVPIVAISHNSGDCWPARSILRIPGDIVVRISPPMETNGASARDVTRMARTWIRDNAPVPLRDMEDD